MAVADPPSAHPTQAATTSARSRISGSEAHIAHLGRAGQAARSRMRSIRRTRPACVSASGITLSVVTPDSFSAASRSATWPSEPMSEIPASSSAGTSAAASSLRPSR